MREKLIELLSEVQYLGGLEEKIADRLIANDVIQVVRCKDCRFTEGRSKYGWLWCGKWNDARDDYGYCYRGERRTDETKTD